MTCWCFLAVHLALICFQICRDLECPGNTVSPTNLSFNDLGMKHVKVSYKVENMFIICNMPS